ncbi:MAG: hypothetical protein ACRDIY_19675 [Chloroflexota bacterium]
MRRDDSRHVNWPALIAGGVVVIAVAAVAVQLVPELAPIRRYTREAEGFASHLPQHARALLSEARERVDRAKHAFRVAQAESERALTAQFEEAKQRGSVPPI